jgi:hypothetical protein
MNVFGFPDTSASESVPASLPTSVCSLGFGGEIIIGFSGKTLKNGPGADFIVFENAFINKFTGKTFVEPGIISVSADGINFTEFPYDMTTLAGCAGTHPTKKDHSVWDTTYCGGNAYDLSDLGLDRIKYIKIKDTTHYLLEHKDNPYYDPTVTGFDLDAVVGIYPIDDQHTVSVDDSKSFQVFNIRQSDDALTILTDKADNYKVELFGMNGDCVMSINFMDRIDLRTSELPTGVYYYFISSNNYRLSGKFSVIR